LTVLAPSPPVLFGPAHGSPPLLLLQGGPRETEALPKSPLTPLWDNRLRGLRAPAFV